MALFLSQNRASGKAGAVQIAYDATSHAKQEHDHAGCAVLDAPSARNAFLVTGAPEASFATQYDTAPGGGDELVYQVDPFGPFFPFVYLHPVADDQYLDAGGSEAEVIQTFVDNKWVLMNRFNIFVQILGFREGTAGTPIPPNSAVVGDIVNGLAQFKQTLGAIALVQMFSGRDLVDANGEDVKGGSVQRQLCTHDAVGVIERRSGALERSRLSAHEIGHNLNACHIGSDTGQNVHCQNLGPSCVNPSQADAGTLMAAALDDVTKDQLDLACNPARVRTYTQEAIFGNEGPGVCLPLSLSCGNVDASQQGIPDVCKGGLPHKTRITATDAQAALLMAVGSLLPSPLADVTADSVVSATDSLKILRFTVCYNETLVPCGGSQSPF